MTNTLPLMESKARPNHAIYLAVLRSMTAEDGLNKALELSEMARKLFRQGLQQRFPQLSQTEFHALYLQRLAKCHNRNY